MYILGVDPGPLPGIVRLHLLENTDGAVRLIGADAMQVTPGMVIAVLEGLHQLDSAIDAIAIERFVVGRRAARSATPAAGSRTRDMIGELTGWATEKQVITVHTRTAAEVKPWAVDKRLHAAGLLDITAGMRHGRDAARHALFCAVKDYGMPDPLSSRAGGR
jgi:hypothetical protein